MNIVILVASHFGTSFEVVVGMLKHSFLFTLMSLLISCTGQNYSASTIDKVKENVIDKGDSSIVGGQEVLDTSTFSKMVVMVRGAQESKEIVGDQEVTRRAYDVCTGAFISENIILTAAHCIFEEPYKLEIVYSGNLQDPSAATAQIEKVVKYPAYKELGTISTVKMDDDIALIKIVGTKPADYKILGLTTFPRSAHGFTFTALGFGRTSGKVPPSEDSLQGLGVLRSSSSKAISFDPQKNFFMADQRAGHGVCSGDSGGPAIVKLNNKHYVIGIANEAVRDNSDDTGDVDMCRFKAAYVSVQYYSDWITKTIKSLQ